MDWLIGLDHKATLFINSLSGHFPLADKIMMGLANDYFVPVTFSLGLLILWFARSNIIDRESRQIAVLRALVALGLACAIVPLINLWLFRPRPIFELPVNVLLYTPTDSSFPSNSAAVLFAVAVSIWISDRRAGSLLLIIATLGAFSRVYVGMHYTLDVLSGAALGVAIALLARWLFVAIDPILKRALAFARSIYIA